MENTNAILTWNKKTVNFEMVDYPLPSLVINTADFATAVNSVLLRRYTDIATCEVTRKEKSLESAEKALTDALAKWEYNSMPTRKESMETELAQWGNDIPLLTADLESAEDESKKRKLSLRLSQTENRIANLQSDLTKLENAKECADLEISKLRIKLDNCQQALTIAKTMLSKAKDLCFISCFDCDTLWGDRTPAVYATLWINVAGEDKTGTKPEPVSIRGCASLYRMCTDFWNTYGSTTPDEKSGDKTADWKRIRDAYTEIGARLNGPAVDGVRKMFAFTANKKTINDLIAFAGETLKPDKNTGKIKTRTASELEFQEQVLAHIFKCAIKIDDMTEKESRREVV